MGQLAIGERDLAAATIHRAIRDLTGDGVHRDDYLSACEFFFGCTAVSTFEYLADGLGLEHDAVRERVAEQMLARADSDRFRWTFAGPWLRLAKRYLDSRKPSDRISNPESNKENPL